MTTATKTKMQNVCLKLPGETITRLRNLAHIESLRTGRQLTWSGMLREMIHTHMLSDVAMPTLSPR